MLSKGVFNITSSNTLLISNCFYSENTVIVISTMGKSTYFDKIYDTIEIPCRVREEIAN